MLESSDGGVYLTSILRCASSDCSLLQQPIAKLACCASSLFASNFVVQQGVRLIKQNHPHLNPVFIFISPPTMSVLRSRLVGRGTETEEAVQARLETALKEIAYVKDDPKVVDAIVINDDLDRAYGLLEKLALGHDVKGDALPALDDQ